MPDGPHLSDHNGWDEGSIELAYIKKARALQDEFETFGTAVSGYEAQVGMDWDLLSRLSRELQSGRRDWPTTLSAKTVASASTVYAFSLFQALMPIKYVIWYWRDVGTDDICLLKRIQAIRALCVDVFQGLPRSVSILIRYFPIPHAKQV